MKIYNIVSQILIKIFFFDFIICHRLLMYIDINVPNTNLQI